MLLDLNRFQGVREHVERTFQPAAFDPQDEDYKVIAPVELTMDVTRAGGDAFRITGTYKTRLELMCSRCLESLQVPFEGDFDQRYLPASKNAGGGEREIGDEDLGVSYFRDGSLDLRDLLREQFQLALPMKPLCSDTCRGLCAVCGANLNRTQCDCQPKWTDPRLAALEELLNRDKEN